MKLGKKTYRQHSDTSLSGCFAIILGVALYWRPGHASLQSQFSAEAKQCPSRDRLLVLLKDGSSVRDLNCTPARPKAICDLACRSGRNHGACTRESSGRDPIRITREIRQHLVVLPELIAEMTIDHFVVGTRDSTGVRKFILGPVAQSIFRQTPCPVLTVGSIGGQDRK